jgi:nucleotide-binding universal stress UspA family protein
MRKDIIISVDFTEGSLHAARYAASMLSGKNNIHVILYNMFEEEEESATVADYLNNLKTELGEKGVQNIECISEFGEDFIDSLGRLAYQKNAELIIMGITEKDEWKQIFIGSKSVKMAEQNVCPVMIIPPDSVYNGINNVALASDFIDVNNNTPVLAIKTVLEMFNASLHIVNVNSEHYVSLSEEYIAERENMQNLFSEFNPEFYFIGTNDFEETISQFAVDKNIDLIIVIPKNHSLFKNMFGKGSHTKKLAFQSPVPLLAAHQ